MKRKTLIVTAVLLAALVAGLFATRTASAQGPGNPGPAQGPDNPGPGDPDPAQAGRLPLVMPLACSTTDYASVVAKALGMTASDLRVALVSGKTLQDLATSKNVQYQTLVDAVTAAIKADLDQAVKDGLLTQAQADRFNQLQGRFPGGMSGRGATMFGGLMGGRGFGGLASNTVQPFVVAAQAIGISCPDLVKALQQGKSIVQVATDKNVQAQTVIDALVKAYKDALAQDVKEGLITQAQADARSARLVEQVTAMISRPGLMSSWMGGMMDRMGQMFGWFFGPGNGGRTPLPQGNRRGGAGKSPANPPATPQATPNAVQ
jgi:hypothetical protein